MTTGNRQTGVKTKANVGRAETVDTAYQALDPSPLLTPQDFQAFYKGDINRFRGMDRMALLSLGLERAAGAQHYKALVMGHSGVGKSTELTRLLQKPSITERYRPIRLSMTEYLDPVGFKPFDVLLIMLIEMVEQTKKPRDQGGAGKTPADSLLERVWLWFATETSRVEKSTSLTASMEAGAGIKETSILAKVLGLFANLRGEMKYASTRKKEVVEYRLSQLNSLLEACNDVMRECNRLLAEEAEGREWLFIIEDFDKAGVSPEATEDFFVTYANIIRSLQCHLVFTLPIALGYSSKGEQLPVPRQQVFCIQDVMVFERDHSAHREARQAIRAVLEARVDPKLFASGQIERLIVASGGNLRDLFALTSLACDGAILRGGIKVEKVEEDDVTQAVRELRSRYERRLGDSPHDEALSTDGHERITYDKKAELMLRIYQGDESAKVPNAVLYSLLRARAVQEFNGEHWFGIHPLVVDILAAQGRIERGPDGRAPGGTI
jgi:hypothetical protein